MHKKYTVLFSVCVLLLALGTVGCSRSRSDAAITADVQNMLNVDSTLASKQIAVQCEAGTVSLSGNVGSEAERSAAEKIARQVVGVKQVNNNLQVVTATAAPPVAPPKPSAHMQKPTTVRTA